MRRPLSTLVVLSASALTLTFALVPDVGSSGASASPSSEHAARHGGARGVTRGVKHVPVPKKGRAVDTSRPDHVVGSGTASSCTSKKVVRAVAKGGIITFDCGPDPVVIAMRRTAKVFNSVGGRAVRPVVIDGGGLVTLSGLGKRRILYQDTCDQRQHWTTDHCDDQAFPKLVVQHLTFARGNSSGNHLEGGGGGAIFDRGGQLKIVDSHFVDNRCDHFGPDLGGAAVRVLSQFHGHPVYVVGSSFRGGRCSNGSGLSSIGVSWNVLNSVFVDNLAIGIGANPPHRPGQPGGGSGGAIYTDGDTYTLRVAGTLMRHNHAREGGGAIFYVSNDLSGRLHIHWSTLKHNVSARFETRPGIFYEGRGPIEVRHSIIR